MVEHILRHGNLIKRTIDGSTEGRKSRRRPRLECTMQAIQDVPRKSYGKVKKLV